MVIDLLQDDPKKRWIECGYRQFALYGPDNLSIKQISKELDVARTSFYHHFGDIHLFIDDLLAYHWRIVEYFNTLAAQHCRQLIPDIYLALEKFPVELQFNLQLFHHRHNPAFNYFFAKSYYASAKAFAMQLFIERYNLTQPWDEVYRLWLAVGETWYSRLDPHDLSAATMQKHSEEILASVMSFVKSDLYKGISQK